MYQINNNTYAIEEGEVISFVRDGGGELRIFDAGYVQVDGSPYVEYKNIFSGGKVFISALKDDRLSKEEWVLNILGDKRTGMTKTNIVEFINTAQLDMEDKHRR